MIIEMATCKEDLLSMRRIRQLTHTWLIFDAKRAANSSLCARLGFSASERAFRSQYGVNRILVRDERSAFCEKAIRQTQQYLAAGAQKNGHNSHYDQYPSGLAATVRPNL